MLYLSKRLDAPVEMVTLLLSAIDEHCGATATKDSVARWKKEWKSPSSPSSLVSLVSVVGPFTRPDGRKCAPSRTSSKASRVAFSDVGV